MFIRDALINDLDGITDCCKRFFEYARFEDQGLPLDENSFRNMVATDYVENPDGIVLLLMNKLYVAGGIAGKISQWGFNTNIKMCVELFWWVDIPYRGRKSIELLKQYEDKAKALGAHKSVMVSINTHLQDYVNHLYERMGYKKNEQFFIKSL